MSIRPDPTVFFWAAPVRDADWDSTIFIERSGIAVRVPEIQALLQKERIDGWLFCDFRRSNPIAYQALELDVPIVTRRWYYFVPASGEPRKLVSAIEPHALDELP